MLKLFARFIAPVIIGFLLASTAYSLPNAEGIQVYQKNMHLSPEHKRKLADDISRYQNADNIWDVLRDEFSLAHYENNQMVQDKIEWYMNNQDFLLRSATRAAPYLYYILQQVKKRHLPAELVLLPIIESGYNPFALSNVGATGIWQLMPDTASGLGVHRDWWYDGRRDVIASTRAALNYLAYLQSFFDGNWLLAIAAYNTGEGNVSAAIRRNIRDGLDTDFWSLPVAQQTRDYVPSLLALAIIISHPDQYPIYFPPVRNAPYLAQVETGSQINLKLAASLAGLNYKKLVQLNPGLNRPGTGNGQYKLVLPIENVEQFSENLSRTSPATRKPINWTHYRVKAGDTLASVSRKFNTTPAALRKMNHLSRTKNTLRHGTSLIIPDSNKNAESEQMGSMEVATADEAATPPTKKDKIITFAKKARKATEDVFIRTSSNNEPATYLMQPGDTIYMVRSTDTLEKIASRFHVSAKKILSANRISEKNIHDGKQLIIPTGHPTSKLASAVEVDKDLMPGDTIYMVRRGDTIEKIAEKFKTTPSAIKLSNFVDNRSLFEGEKLIVPTHISG